MKKDLLEVTDAAKDRVRVLLGQRDTPALGVRIGVRTRGCSGLSYTLEYVEEIVPQDEFVECGDFKIVVDPKAMLFVIGMVMDFVDEETQSGFVFRNPNEKGRCGCGESFHV